MKHQDLSEDEEICGGIDSENRGTGTDLSSAVSANSMITDVLYYLIECT